MAQRSPLVSWLVLTGLTFGLILLGLAAFRGEALAPFFVGGGELVFGHCAPPDER